jgi:NADH dehydrogenase
MIFISGGTGFIGSHAVKRLVSAGHNVRLLITGGHGLAAGLPKDRTEYVNGSVTDTESLRGTMDDCDATVNFVGIIVQVGDATFERIHAQGVKNLLDEAKRAGVKRFVHISALGTSDRPVSEYFRTKLKAEQLIKASGIPYVILRPSLVFGPEDKFFNTLKPLLCAPIQPVIGTGKTMFQPIWVEDIASCIVKAVEDDRPVNGVWEIGGPEQVTFDELLDRMGEALGHARRPKLHIPTVLMKPVATIMEALLSRPPLTNDQLKMLSIDNMTESNALADVFGVTPKSLGEALKEYWKK